MPYMMLLIMCLLHLGLLIKRYKLLYLKLSEIMGVICFICPGKLINVMCANFKVNMRLFYRVYPHFKLVHRLEEMSKNTIT